MTKRYILFFIIMLFVKILTAQTKTYNVVLANPCSESTSQQDTTQVRRDSLNVFTCNIDTVKLKVQNFQYGTLVWEQSYDGVNWISIVNEVDTILIFKPSITSYYRVVNKLPYCQPIISSSVLINNIPLSNAGSNRLVNDNFTYLKGNSVFGAIGHWSIIEGTGGSFEKPDSAYTKFVGIPASNEANGPTGKYKISYTLTNNCGSTSDTIDVNFIFNQYSEKIIVVDETDSILSTPEQIENGEYIIKFSDPTLNIEPQTILIGVIGDGFMRKVESVTKKDSVYTMTTTQAKIDEILTKGGLDLGLLYNVESVNQSLKARGYTKLNKLPTRLELKSENFKTGCYYYVKDDSIGTPINGVTATKIKSSSKTFLDKANKQEVDEYYIQYNFDETVLFDKEISNGSTNGNLKGTLNGSITLKPNIVSDVHIGLDNTSVKLGVDNATLDLKSQLAIEATLSGEYETGEVSLGSPIKTNLWVAIAGVPTLIQIRVEINYKAKVSAEGAAKYINEYDKTYKVNAGVTYENNIWGHYYDASESSKMTHNLEIKGSVNASLDIGPTIYITVDHLAGPYVDMKMTSDLNLCASSQNLQDFNWQADAFLGGKLTLGVHAYLFKKELFDYNKTFENRKLFHEQYPYMLEYISGNNQQYTIGNTLEKPLKIRIKSMYGIPARFIMVKFDAIDNCGTLSKTTVITDADGYAETTFTPNVSGKCNIQVSAKDCDFQYLMNAPFTFFATEKSGGFDCSKTTLSASIKKLGSKLVLFGYMGVPPYTYSTDLITYSTERPQIMPISGENYSWSVKDANGCIAYANFKENTVACKNSDLNLDVELLGNNVQLIAKGGFEPYSYSLDGSSYTSTPSFRNLTIGNHVLTVKDANECEINRTINISNATQYILPYFDVVSTVSCYAPVYFSNLSANANSYFWDFGDNRTSTLENPIHIYTNIGKYAVKLTITNGNIQKSFTKIITVNALNSNIFNPYKATLVYFVDSESNYSHKKQIYLDENGISTNEFNIDISEIPNGGHTLYVKAIDANGRESFIQRQSFWKDAVSINQTPNLQRIEYFFDTDPGINKGNAIPFTAGKTADIAYTIDLNGVANGGHTLYVRSIDQNGKSSFIQRQSFWKDAVSVNQTPNLKRIEYFFDTDPGINKGNAIPFTAGKSVDLAYTIDLSSVSNGGHTLYVRSIDQNGKSSFIQRQSFWKDAVSVNQTPNLKRIEYFFDTDPGINKGNAIPFTAGKSVDLAYTIDLTGVNNGGHTLYVRSIDQNGKSSFIQRQSFWKTQSTANPNIVKIEYFVNREPDAKSIFISKQNQAPFIDTEFDVDMTGLTGKHLVYMRAKDSNGHWSFIQVQEVCAGVNIDFETDKTIYTPDEIINFNILSNSTQSYNYAWDFLNTGNFVTTSESSITYQYNQPGSYQVNLKVSDSDGCSSIISKVIYVSTLTGINNKAIDKLHAILYPNPTKGEIHIKFNHAIDQINLTVYSIDGKELLSTTANTINGEIKLDLSQLTDGLYIIKALCKTNSFVKQIIIKK